MLQYVYMLFNEGNGISGLTNAKDLTSERDPYFKRQYRSLTDVFTMRNFVGLQ